MTSVKGRWADMFLFALKNMATKKIQLLLVILSVVVSAGIGVLAYNVAGQVGDGITGTAGYFGVIVGPSGSKTQLAMNTMYFTDTPLGTLPYETAEALAADPRVKEAVPFAMADNYNGAPVIGTTPAFLREKTLAKGDMFTSDGLFEVVVGASVAKKNKLSVGDSIRTGHSATEMHASPFTVVGILEESHTAYDNVVFVSLPSLWAVHDSGHDEEHHGDGDDHAHMHDAVCAVLLSVKNPSYAMQIVNEYDGKIITDEDGDSVALTAIEPMETVRSVLEEADNTKYLVFVLCGVILVMNIIIVSVVTLLNMMYAKGEISLMRLIGIGMKKINLLYLTENGLVGLVSVLLAFGLSRLCLGFMQEYVSSMGVVLNGGKVYPAEIFILLGVFLISVLPTVICTFVMSRRDGLGD